jgi:hypothetical protein
MESFAQVAGFLFLVVVWHFPTYLPVIVALGHRGARHRVVRISLYCSSVVALLVSTTRLGRPIVDHGNDVAGNIAGAVENFAWTWGGGFVCLLVGLGIGHATQLILRSQRANIMREEPSD